MTTETEIPAVRGDGKTLLLPPPSTQSRFSVERALAVRRSIRDYTNDPLNLAELAQLLWSSQGITSPEGFRTTPSAGAIFPLEIYAAVSNVKDLAAGVYHYLPGRDEHQLEFVKRGDVGPELFALSTQQDFIKQVPLNIVMVGILSKMADKYGPDIAPRYVFMEMGHAAQNIHLQAEALDLGSVAVGFLQEAAVRELFGIEGDPQYMVSIGHKKG
jgi:SagB-type dehydrogenase family enzyme